MQRRILTRALLALAAACSGGAAQAAWPDKTLSLVVPYDPKTIRDSSSPYRGTLIRFCIGLEAVEDLIADATQALAVLAA